MQTEKIGKAYLVLVLGIMAVSSSSILIRFAQESVPSIAIAAYRLSIASITLLPVVIFKSGKDLRNLLPTQLLFLFISGIFLAIHFVTWITSLEYTSVSSSVVLVTTTPIWVAIFSPLFLKEKITIRIWIGILITILGSIIVSMQDNCGFDGFKLTCTSFFCLKNDLTFWGNFLALCGAWAAAGYMIVGRKIRQHIPATVYIFCVYSIAAMILVISSLFLKVPLLGYSGRDYGWLILLGLVPQLLGHSSFNYALGYLPAAYVSVALIGEPIGTIILAFFLLSEMPTIGDYLGGSLILIGIMIISLIKIKKRS